MLATEQILLKDRIRHLLHIKKCTIASLAENETERVRISRQINGDANVTIDTIRLILFSFPSVSADWLILGEGTIHKATTAPTVYNNNSVNNSTAGGNITTGNIANNFNANHLPSGCLGFQPERNLQNKPNFQPVRKPYNNPPTPPRASINQSEPHRASIIDHYESMIASLRSDLEQTRLSLQTTLSEIEQLKHSNQSSMSILSSLSSSASSISADHPRQPRPRKPRQNKSTNPQSPSTKSQSEK